MANDKSQISNLISNIPYYVIIVAGGAGSRMQSTTPKQFLLLNGLPVMMHTIKTFAESTYQPQIIVALPQEFHKDWKLLSKEYHFDIKHLLAPGGDTRFESVKNALALITDENTIVAIQDAVRPLVSQKIIDNSFAIAAQKGNAVTAVKSRDTIREQVGESTKHVDRDKIYLVQTPQTFKASILKKAYKQEYNNTFTDDASVVESIGEKINLVEGSHSNIKITYPDDIAIAEAIQKKLPV